MASDLHLVHPTRQVLITAAAGVKVVGVNAGLGAVNNASTAVQYILPTTRANSAPTTLLAWLKISAQQRNNWGFFNSALTNYMLLASRSDRTQRAFHTGQFSASASLTSGNEYHLAGIFNGLSSRTLYVDGVAQTENTTSIADATLDRLYLASDVAGTDPIGEGRVYDGILSAYQISALAIDPSEKWAIYAPLTRRLYIELGGGSGPADLTCDAGSYTVTGNAATLTVARVLTCDAGSYSLTGHNATLTKASVLALDAGSYTLTGQSATFTKASVLLPDAGAYTLTGNDATLTYQQAGSLACEAGTYTVTGYDVTLTWARMLTVGVGSYSYTGYAPGVSVVVPIAYQSLFADLTLGTPAVDFSLTTPSVTFTMQGGA